MNEKNEFLHFDLEGIKRVKEIDTHYSSLTKLLK